MTSVYDPDRQAVFGELTRFRHELYGCLTARAEVLFELTVLCTDSPVRSTVRLSLAPEHRRGHGALYDGINHGHIDIARMRNLVAAHRLPKAADGRMVLVVDVSPWLRPDANIAPERSSCHTHGRGRDQHVMVPGWPYSIVTALEIGRTTWTAVLDAVRLPLGADVAVVTAVQIREVVGWLLAAGQWRVGDPEILVVLDAGYDAPRIAHLLADLPVEVLGRMRSDRVLRRPAPPRVPGTTGRPPKHSVEFELTRPVTAGRPRRARPVRASGARPLPRRRWRCREPRTRGRRSRCPSCTARPPR
jgi:hypothetical protein